MWWLILPIQLTFAQSGNPSPGFGVSKSESRSLDCKRLSQERAHELYPGHIEEKGARESMQSQDMLVCERRFLPIDERPARDEAILSSLRQTVGELTRTATALEPDPSLQWHVDAYYPDARVAQKISSAAKMDLVERGRRVSDRVPRLAAGDISVINTLPQSRLYAAACKRYFAEGTLSAKQALLGIMIVDPRETQLHGGVCLNGTWRWLQ